MARAMGGAPAEIKVRITSAPPAKRAAGAAGKCLVGQQPSEPGGALDERGHTEQVREIGPAPLFLKPRTYGSRGPSPVNIGSNNRGP